MVWQRKIKQIQAKMAERNLDALVLLQRAQRCVCHRHFPHLPTERPLAVLIPAKGESAVRAWPRIGSGQARWIKDVEVYFDYPGPVKSGAVDLRAHQCPRTGAAERLESRSARLLDSRTFRWELKAKLMEAGDIVEQMRWVKDADEIGVMRRATYFADYTEAAGRAYIEANEA